MLRDFYYSDDRRVDSAVLVLEEARGMVVSVFFGFFGILGFGFRVFGDGDLEFCFVWFGFIFGVVSFGFLVLVLGMNGGCVDDDGFFVPLF